MDVPAKSANSMIAISPRGEIRGSAFVAAGRGMRSHACEHWKTATLNKNNAISVPVKTVGSGKIKTVVRKPGKEQKGEKG